MIKQLPLGLCLSLLFLGCTGSEQDKQPAEQPPADKQPAAEKNDQAQDKPVKASLPDRITISRETTRITQPLDDDGYVDYLQALNDQATEGVTPENNFEVIVRQVMPFEEISENLRSEYFRLLGIPIPDENKDFFQEFIQYALEQNNDPKQEDKVFEEHDRVMIKPWTATEHPLASTWVKIQEKHLDQLVEGSRREKFYTPYLADVDEETGPMFQVVSMLLPSIQQQRGIARGLAIRALGRIGEEDLDGAWSDLQAMRRISRHVSHGVTLIEELVAIAIDRIAFNAEFHVLNSSALTADQCKRFFADLQSMPPLPPMADKIDVGERFMGLDAAIAIARSTQGKDHMDVLKQLMQSLKLIGALSDATVTRDSMTQVALQEDVNKQESRQVSSLIDWNVTLQVLNRWYDKLVTANRLKDLAQCQAALESIEQEIEQMAAKLTNPASLLKTLGTQGSAKAIGESLGHILVATLLPATSAVIRAERRHLAHNQVILVGFAVELYRRDMGMLPIALADLSPRYLPAIPRDPLSDDPLKYTVKDKGFLLYSVGLNGVDDQGKTGHDAEQEEVAIQPEWDDITVRVDP